MFDAILSSCLLLLSIWLVQKYNIAELFSFIPDEKLTETGITLYTTMFLIIYHIFVKRILDNLIPKIEITFYSNENDISPEKTPSFNFKSDVTRIYLRITIKGNTKILKKLKVRLSVPDIIDLQLSNKNKVETGDKGCCVIKLADYIDKFNKKICESSVKYKIDLITAPTNNAFNYTITPTFENIPWCWLIRKKKNSCKIFYDGN